MPEESQSDGGRCLRVRNQKELHPDRITSYNVCYTKLLRPKGIEYLEIVRNPRHGRGAGLNPCIDCRIFTLKKAREYMEQVGASFLVTGEVVGQRPMSQRSDAFRIIEKRSGCQGLVLRPLSAKYFEPSIAEREGWVDREHLLHITGRSRKEQIRLAEEWEIGNYHCPAGGCLLTDKTFSRKVRA